MSYKSYKQLYRIVLNSQDAETNTTLVLLHGELKTVVKKYFFPLKIELPFSTQARIAVKKFNTNNVASANYTYNPHSTGAIYSPTISQRNTYQSVGTSKGCLLLSHQFVALFPTEYINPDIEFNYIDIQNNTSWLTNGIELIVESKLLGKVDVALDDTNLFEIAGYPEDDDWTLELIIFDAELEQNPAFHPLKPFQNGNAPTYG